MAARKKTPRRAKSGADTSALVPITGGQLPDYSASQETMDRQQASLPSGAGMPRIRGESGTIYLPGDQHGVDSTRVIVLAALRRNAWYAEKYDAKNPSPPSCGAIQRLGQHENELAPGEGWPDRQHDRCYGCVRNISPTKDCRNSLWLACVSAEGDLTGLDWSKTPIAQCNVSATGIGEFAKVAKLLHEKRVPLHATVVQLQNRKVEGQTYYTTYAEPVSVVQPEVERILAGRVEEAERELLAFAQPVATVAGAEARKDERPEPRRRKKGGARKPSLRT